MFGKALGSKADVFAYDINITPEMQSNAVATHVNLSRDLSAALKNAQMVFSLVTADQAQCAAHRNNDACLSQRTLSPASAGASRCAN